MVVETRHETIHPLGDHECLVSKDISLWTKVVERLTTSPSLKNPNHCVTIMKLTTDFYRFILITLAFPKMLFCKIFLFPLKTPQNNNSAGRYREGLMGRMLKLMGNVSPARREAFLTLMERGMRRGRVGG